MIPAPTILEISDLCLRYHRNSAPILRHISISILAGEIFVLMGASGSGKSSLLRCLNGLNGRGGESGHLHGKLILTHGSERLNLTEATESQWRSVRSKMMAMVFQEPTLQPWRTVGENLAFPLELRRLPKDEIKSKVEAQLQLIRLQNWRDRKPSELSGGMLQRVGIARALITEAPIILMDEPFSALDPLLRRELQDEVLSLNKNLGKTILFVTHDPGEAQRLGSRIAVLAQGEILQVGTPHELIHRPCHPTVTALLQSGSTSHATV